VFCERCGKQLDDSARFCGACGVSTAPGGASISPSAAVGQPAVAPAIAAEKLSSSLRVLGILWAVYSGFRILTAAWTIAFSRMFLPMIGTMIPKNADVDMTPFFHMLSGFYVVSGVYSVLAGAAGIWASWALLKREPAGRMIALVIAFISLISIPFGTALGVYTLVVLLPEDAGRTYDKIATSA
jgi:hypothetical protein